MSEAAVKDIQKVDQGGFSIAALESKDLKEVVKENLSDLGRIQFERVKMPSGGALVFEVTDEDGNPKPVAEITGIIVDRYPVNAYWPDKFAGASNPPQCVAMDGRTGVGDPGGNCATCPHNQWGSDQDSKGKACKNLHRIYILPPGDIMPLLIALPPTSLANFNAYMLRLTNKAKKPYWAVLTKIKLEKATSAQGITYSKAVFSKVGDVPAEKLLDLKAYVESLKPLMRSVEIQAADYDVEASEADAQQPSSEPF
ncbi:MAG TPA: hypothetical protein GXX23_02660 [Firmicutes bacterium]|nr:hypothetical protein [Candidatus Fermentithermobacillaceae bacterium]